MSILGGFRELTASKAAVTPWGMVMSRGLYQVFRGNMSNRHRDPKWKRQRTNQTVRIERPDYEKMRNPDMSFDAVRSDMKKYGVVPARQWREKPLYLGSMVTVIDPYVPPEGDGKASLLSRAGANQKTAQLKSKAIYLWHLRTLKSFEDNFTLEKLCEDVVEIYKVAHKKLADRVPMAEMLESVTENCYMDMKQGNGGKTLRWRYIESLEPPRIVHVMTKDAISKDNIFGQVTLRLHSRQTLAIYDRFGRLMHGSEALVKDVLEYVVFEKHLSDLYGKWRVHAKIIPEWQPARDPQRRTFVVEDEEPQTSEVTVAEATPETVDMRGVETK